MDKSKDQIRKEAEEFVNKYFPRWENKICLNCGWENCRNNELCVKCNCQF